eukprot:986199-Prorocentrum_minimum.AAC.1
MGGASARRATCSAECTARRRTARRGHVPGAHSSTALTWRGSGGGQEGAAGGLQGARARGPFQHRAHLDRKGDLSVKSRRP